MFLEIANEVIENEINGIKEVKANLGTDFEELIEYISKSNGRVVMCGMGKSGHIAKKIFATLVSTGTPSMFMHPAEAFHGDLGMIKSEDMFFAISNSGETPEVTQLLPFIKARGNTLIAMTGNKSSTLARLADFHVDISISKEACPLNLAPTTSTTVSLVVGDAIAVSLMKANDFKEENFATYHPGGSLGKRLLLKVGDVARKPVYASLNSKLIDIMKLMSDNLTGIIVVGNEQYCHGVITDGDIRKFLAKANLNDLSEIFAEQLMTVNPHSIQADVKCSVSDEKMESLGINTLLVKQNTTVVGVYDNLNRKK